MSAIRRYSFCERVTASPLSPHHIRPLKGHELKTGGGADTVALCGAEVAWDTSYVAGQIDWDAVTKPRTGLRDASWRACPKCVDQYQSLTNGDPR